MNSIAIIITMAFNVNAFLMRNNYNTSNNTINANTSIANNNLTENITNKNINDNSMNYTEELSNNNTKITPMSEIYPEIEFDKNICKQILNTYNYTETILNGSSEFNDKGEYKPVNSSVKFIDYSLISLESMFSPDSYDNLEGGYNITGNALINLAGETEESSSLIVFVDTTTESNFISNKYEVEMNRIGNSTYYEKLRSLNKRKINKRLLADGADRSLRWKRDSILRYNVDYNSFKTKERGQVVKDEMAKAAKVWNYIVPQIKWAETTDRDRSLFVVRNVAVGVEKKITFSARSFFPKTERCRYLYLTEYWFKNYANYKTSQPTTLIHELGHILGFRHTDAVRHRSGKIDEDDDVFYIGNNDKLSVMGYEANRIVTKQDIIDGGSYYSMPSGTNNGHTIQIKTPDQVYINYKRTRCPLFQACKTENTPKC